MILEARATNCFATTFVVKMNGRPVGRFDTRWYSVESNIAMTERRQLRFERVGWLNTHFTLKREGDQEPIGWAARSGFFSSAWDLRLSCGAAQLVRAGWFQTGYIVQQKAAILGRVDQIGRCAQSGWVVEAEYLCLEDMVLVGMIHLAIARNDTDRNFTG
jgi:hypothetical protein